MKNLPNPFTYHPELVCPYCGYEHSDAWELSADDGDYECGNQDCGKTFRYSRMVTVEYTTFKFNETGETTGGSDA